MYKRNCERKKKIKDKKDKNSIDKYYLEAMSKTRAFTYMEERK